MDCFTDRAVRSLALFLARDASRQQLIHEAETISQVTSGRILDRIVVLRT
jgi:hypothetical protein